MTKGSKTLQTVYRDTTKYNKNARLHRKVGRKHQVGAQRLS